MNPLLEQLGIVPATLANRVLQSFEEATQLVVAETDDDGREYFLTPSTCTAWQKMKTAAQEEGVTLLMVSAFRSVQRQTEIIQKKLLEGQTIEQILEVSAPPGYSEHHTGRAIDISCPEEPDLELSFENTNAFLWLKQRAASFGFVMSYPPDNPAGFQYEPWHWCFQEDQA